MPESATAMKRAASWRCWTAAWATATTSWGADYTIVDIATFPWVRSVIRLCEAEDHIGVAAFQNVSAWFARCMDRPAVQRGLTVCALDEN